MSISPKALVKTATYSYLVRNVIAMKVYLTTIPTMINVTSWVGTNQDFLFTYTLKV